MRAFLAGALAVLLVGCVFLTDAATRAAYDIEAAAAHMRAKGLDRLEFVHVPKAEPDGVVGPWDLLIQQSGQMGVNPGALCIGRYHTSYHNNFVRVPRTLSIAKKAGEGVTIVLRREGDVIELVELR
jgi:uncharacterized membrane protein YdfJ with MMPL/SSD domain